MSKFNLKTYQKINTDQHIDSRLKQDHKKSPEVINEKQLSDYRSEESTVTTEKQLEDSRKSAKITEATEITERRLDTEKGKFNIEFRNSSAFDGDLNKVEEQRLKGDPSEKEKYDLSSSTPKKLRWWETAPKSPDGLKVAQKKSVNPKTAQYRDELAFDAPRFEDTLEDDISPVEVEDDVIPSEEAAINPVDQIKKEYEIEDELDIDTLPDFDIDDKDTPDIAPMHITDTKEMIAGKPSLYVVFEYDAEDYNRDEMSIKQAALNKILEERPQLKGIIDISDMYGVKIDKDGKGRVALRSIDDRLRDILSPEENVEELTEDTNISLDEEGNIQGLFQEDSYEVKNIGGTPIATGAISMLSNIAITDDNRDTIIDQAIDYIQKKYSIEIDSSSLDLSNLVNGEIKFMIESPHGLESAASVNFPVIEITGQNIKKK